MARVKKSEAIRPGRRKRKERSRLRKLLQKAKRDGDLKTWRRAKAVLDYIGGKSVVALGKALEVARSSIYRWFRRFNEKGTKGLRGRKHPGSKPRLTKEQLKELSLVIQGGPQAAGFDSGVWTGPMIGHWIRRRFGVKYHAHHIPRLLHQLGFSVQRPRKRLARADAEKQKLWRDKRFPALKKKAEACGGVVLFEDEASFWLDGTLHWTWAAVGCQPRVDTYGQRKTAHLFGAINLEDAQFTYRFADVFNGYTFWWFLRQLVSKYQGRKVFLVIDNAPFHNLPEEGKEWLKEHADDIELARLPPYSPEFNPMEPVWKTTRKMTTHNRFYRTTEDRDTALRRTFAKFRRKPSLIDAHVARLR